MIGGAPYDYREPPPFGMVELLDRREECVEVEKTDSRTVPLEDVMRVLCHAPIIG